VDPELDHLGRITLVGARGGHHETFNDLGKFSKVELVVELSGRRREGSISEEFIEDNDGSFD